MAPVLIELGAEWTSARCMAPVLAELSAAVTSARCAAAMVISLRCTAPRVVDQGAVAELP